MSLDPPENLRNIIFLCNAGPVKNHKVSNLAFNVGPSLVCQQIQWHFADGPDVVTLTVSPIKKVKVGPLCQNIMPQSVLATPMWFSSWCDQSRLNWI